MVIRRFLSGGCQRVLRSSSFLLASFCVSIGGDYVIEFGVGCRVRGLSVGGDFFGNDLGDERCDVRLW